METVVFSFGRVRSLQKPDFDRPLLGMSGLRRRGGCHGASVTVVAGRGVVTSTWGSCGGRSRCGVLALRGDPRRRSGSKALAKTRDRKSKLRLYSFLFTSVPQLSDGTIQVGVGCVDLDFSAESFSVGAGRCARPFAPSFTLTELSSESIPRQSRHSGHRR